MDVISSLVGRLGLISTRKYRELLFEHQELRKLTHERLESFKRLQTEAGDVQSRLGLLQRQIEEIEQRWLEESDRADLAASRANDLISQVEYLKEQVKIYQTRLGLLPQERQGALDKGKLEPLKKGREPFAVAAARVQAQRTQEYWERKAKAVDGITSSETVTSKETNDVPNRAEEGGIQD